MAYQQQHDGYSQPRQQQYYEQAPPRGRGERQQYADYDGQYAQHYDGHYNEHYADQYDQHYEGHYDQHYDYSHNQGGHEQWDSGYYDQQGGYHDGNGYARQAPQEQGRRPPPQQHHQGHEQAHHEHYQQPPPQQRQDTRSRPSGRGNGPPPNSQQERGGLRPAGLDRSLFNPAPQKNLPLDSPFPTFPTQKAKQPAPKDTISGPMSQMSIKDRDGHGRQAGSPGRGQPGPQQNRDRELPRPDSNNRQDSGHFEGHGQGQRGAPPRTMSGQRPPPMNMNVPQETPRQRTSDPKSPSQQTFGANTQRSMTMPRNLPSGTQGGHSNQQQWSEPGGVSGHYGSASHNQTPPRPSTAGGVRQNEPQGQRPPMPAQPAQQQQQRQQHHAPDQHYQGQDDSLDTFYDDYYGESNDHIDRTDRTDRKSMASTIDMPNFDAIPETGGRHRRGDSIDNHLSPSIAPPRGIVPTTGSVDSGSGYNNSFQQQAHRSRSQPNIHEQYTTAGSVRAGDAPPVPGLPRANTDFANGLPNGPRGGGQPSRGMTVDGVRGTPNQGYTQEQFSDLDPRYRQQPPPVQRGYSDESAYSEPPLNTMRNASTPFGSGNPIPRPGTAGPVSGRVPADPLGRRPGTTQPRMNPDALPAHPAPVRAGLMQQNQPTQQPMQSSTPQNARPLPVRQYNSGTSQTSLESQQSPAQRPVSVSHPVTHDELNRLRNTWTANPRDNATALKLAKKLVEAASVLADEGGTADSRTRNKNREKFILEGHKIIKKLVNVGYPDAMFYLADCYGQGLLGLQPDPKEAFALYQSAAKAGHAASAYRTAVCCEMGHEEGGGTKRDLMKAVQWYRRAAALGDVPAMYKMGIILVKGLLGQQKNLGEALNMLKRAADRADRDNPHALHELALIYESQTGNERIIRDEAYSLQLYHQAADLGYKFSQFKLGQAYEYGLLGCQIDARTSIAWYTKSAAQEEHQSELALSGWYLTGIQGVLEQSDTEAYLWARKAACAEPPLPKALFAMGYFTEVGIGCPRSLDEAKRWYGRAAAYKFPKAQERLEELKRGGSKVQMKRERLSRTNQKQQEENCTVM